MKWEYATIGFYEYPAILTRIGMQGWELVRYQNERYIFKRPLAEPVVSERDEGVTTCILAYPRHAGKDQK